MSEPVFKNRTIKSENRVRFDLLPGPRVSRFSYHQKLVQTSNERQFMSIKLNYVSMQNGTTFYLLDLGDHS
jgi:hypothetical protein